MPATRPRAGTDERFERLQPRLAALASLLLHVACLLIALRSPPITVATPQGTAAGGLQVVDVDYIGDTPPPPAIPPPRRTPEASRLQTTAVVRADDPLPPDAHVVSDAPVPMRDRPPEARPATPAPATAPQPKPRRPRQWGQPPGMLSQETAPVNAGTTSGLGAAPGRRHDASSSESNLEAGGYQVIYDLIAERRLREWRDTGMTEIFLPLPGTRQLMACPLETALRRGSGPCRLIEPDDPGLADIGDARQVLSMQQVYRRGELVWRGPGPYR